MTENDNRSQEEPTEDHTQVVPDRPIRSREAHASLVVIHGGPLGQRLKLEQQHIVIGRTPECELYIEQPSISRRHCQISRYGSRYKIKDLGSTNRTYLNDQLVIEAWLADGDHITVGQTILKFVAPGNWEAQYHSEVRQRTILDPLTSLYNRRYFLDVLEREMTCARRYRRPFSLVILDVDRFKPINDELGHLGGDEILQALSGLLRRGVRKNDVVARLGGEEFALLLPETVLQDALGLAEALRLAVERNRFVVEGCTIPITVSLGCTQWQSAMRAASDLMRAADNALYDAKRQGRNRVNG